MMIISMLDFEALMQCIRSIEGRHTTRFDEVQLLRKKVLAAQKADPAKVPSDMVTMNSFVELRRIPDGKEFIVKLVFPGYENVREGKISVFSALGVAILCRRIGDEVVYKTWKTDNRVQIVDITFQPEAHGNYYANKQYY